MEPDLEKATTFFRFEDLRIYHKSMEYIDWVYSKVNSFPNNNSHGIGSRFVHASEAIAMNISEGSARNKSQFIYYLKMAKSSVRECVVHTTLAQKQGLLNDIDVNESRNYLMEMTKMIGALIGSLQRAAGISGEEMD
jgi:four helix bundle protein